MSRVVKKRRRCSPRARWKMLAPCITVLSTSKNAADTASTGVSRARSTSAAAAAASPARVERWRRFNGRRGRSGGAFIRSGYGATAAAWLRWPLRRMPLMPSAHDLTALVRDAAAEQPDKLAVVESGGRRLTLGQLGGDG